MNFDKIQQWLIKRWRWYRHRSLYVIADPADNSITLSRALFNHMEVMQQDKAQVYVFRLMDTKDYAFALNPQIEQPTALCDIQYNSKHRTIGFETLCPTVNRIFYDYNLPQQVSKLSVDAILLTPAEGKPFYIYQILQPYDKPTQ